MKRSSIIKSILKLLDGQVNGFYSRWFDWFDSHELIQNLVIDTSLSIRIENLDNLLSTFDPSVGNIIQLEWCQLKFNAIVEYTVNDSDFNTIRGRSQFLWRGNRVWEEPWILAWIKLKFRWKTAFKAIRNWKLKKNGFEWKTTGFACLWTWGAVFWKSTQSNYLLTRHQSQTTHFAWDLSAKSLWWKERNMRSISRVGDPRVIASYVAWKLMRYGLAFIP